LAVVGGLAVVIGIIAFALAVLTSPFWGWALLLFGFALAVSGLLLFLVLLLVTAGTWICFPSGSRTVGDLAVAMTPPVEERARDPLDPDDVRRRVCQIVARHLRVPVEEVNVATRLW